jgi:two-component system response regulator RpfG
MVFELIEDEHEKVIAPIAVVIDKDPASRAILEKIVRSSQQNIIVKSFADPQEALKWIRLNQADLVMFDHMLSGTSGVELLRQMRHTHALEGVPIVVVTSLEDRNIRYQVLDAGATEIISKPVDPYECRVRCRNMLSLRIQQKIILNRANFLEYRIAEATRKIHQSEQETLLRLARAGEYRDQDTGNHIVRMARYSRLIAEALTLPKDRCDLIEAAAPMHDIGKIGIPDNILLKPGKLELEEFDVMKSHPSVGYQILHNSPSKYLTLGAEIALGHHEKFDGSGYPYGKVGDNIPLEARIVAVADVYDALTSQRPYKRAWSNNDALAYLNNNKGKHFDPDCVEAFVSRIPDIQAIHYLHQ